MELDSPALRNAVQSLAIHALPAFGVALVAVLVAVCCLWWLALRYGVRRETSRFAPPAYLLAYLALGFALVIGAAALFAEIAEHLGDGKKLGELDVLFSTTIGATLPSSAFRVFALLDAPWRHGHADRPVHPGRAGAALAALLRAVHRLGCGDRRQCGAEPLAEKRVCARPPGA